MSMKYMTSVVLRSSLENLGSVENAMRRARCDRPLDVLLLDASDHDPQMLDVVAAARSNPKIRCCIVLHRGCGEFGTQAFVRGADDVVHWQCSSQELAARIFVRLGLQVEKSRLLLSKTNWETEAYITQRAGLTVAESQILRVLMDHLGEIVSRDELSYAVDDRPWRYGDRKFDVHVAKIRRKLSGQFDGKLSVSTVRALGYLAEADGTKLFAKT